MAGQARLLPRISTPEALVSELKAAILHGSLPGGSRLTEIDLAETHGVSRQSIKQALLELSRLGLVEQRRHRGVWVRELTLADVEDLYWTRYVIESEAASYAALEPTSWGRVQRCVEQLERLPADAAWSEVVEADWHFHRELVASVGSVRLSRVHDLLEGETLLSFMRCDYDAPAAVAQVHRALFEVIRTGDPTASTRALRLHLEAGKQLVFENRFSR